MNRIRFTLVAGSLVFAGTAGAQQPAAKPAKPAATKMDSTHKMAGEHKMAATAKADTTKKAAHGAMAKADSSKKPAVKKPN